MRARLTWGLHLVALLLAAGCGRKSEAKVEATAPAAQAEPAPAVPAEAPKPAAPPPAPAEPEPKQPPTIAPHSVLRPVFATTEGEIPAGTAFVVRWDNGSNLLLTAHHLFGPMGGMSRDIAAAELPKVVKSVRAASADDKTVAV